MKIDKALLDILACPKCKGDITLTDDEKGLRCDACHLLYEVREGIPILLIDEATPFE